MRNTSIAHSSVCRLGLAIALTIGAGASQANCTQADMRGVWYATGIATVPFNLTHDDTSFTTFCKIIVNSAGAFNKETSFCKSSAGQSAIEGTMEVIPSCQVRPFNIPVFDKTSGVLLLTQTVDYMAVNRSKDAFTATGNKRSATTGLAQFMWTAVKR